MVSFKQHVTEVSRLKRFSVDYIFQTKTGGPHRTQLVSTNMQLPNLASSETAVLAWLRKRHTGCEITIVSLDWQDI